MAAILSDTYGKLLKQCGNSLARLNGHKNKNNLARQYFPEFKHHLMAHRIGFAYRHFGICRRSMVRRRYHSSEAAGTLKPFYRAVHPDLFALYPRQRAVNEESLKYLNSFLERSTTLSTKSSKNITLTFYLHPRSLDDELSDSGSLPQDPKEIQVHLLNDNVQASIWSILQSCNLDRKLDAGTRQKLTCSAHSDLSTKVQPSYSNLKSYFAEKYCYFDDDGAFFEMHSWPHKETDVFSKMNLPKWMSEISQKATIIRDSSRSARQDICTESAEIQEKFGPSQVLLTCGWTPAVALGALKSLKETLSEHNQESVKELLGGRDLHLSDWTGVTLDESVHFASHAVPQEWNLFLARAKPFEDAIMKLRQKEDDISSCLGGIRIKPPKGISFKVYRESLESLGAAIAADRFNFCFQGDTMTQYQMTVIPSQMAASLSDDGSFMVPSNMTQYEIRNFISLECGRAKRAQALYQQFSNDIEKKMAEIKHKLSLKSLIISDSVGRSEVVYFYSRLLGCLSGDYCEEGLSASDFSCLAGHNVCVDSIRRLSPEGVICVAWNLK